MKFRYWLLVAALIGMALGFMAPDEIVDAQTTERGMQ